MKEKILGENEEEGCVGGKEKGEMKETFWENEKVEVKELVWGERRQER